MGMHEKKKASNSDVPLSTLLFRNLITKVFED